MVGSGLQDLSGLVSLAQERALDLRPVILRVQTDLFVTAPVRDGVTIEAFEALACGLLPLVDRTTAAGIARKLAPLRDTPENVLRVLARHSPDACCAVVALAPSLSAVIIGDAVASASQVAGAFASRADLDERQIGLLVDQNETAVDLALASNHALSLKGAVLDDLVARGRDDAAVAAALLRHPALSPTDQAPLYLHADDVRRREIRHGIAAVAALRNAAFAKDAGLSRRLVDAAERQDAGEFGAGLAGALRLARVPEWRFDAPDRHELLALALRAAGVAEDETVRILLTLHPVIARSTTTVFGLVRLYRAVPRSSALHLVQAVTGCPVQARTEGHHVPALDPSGAPSPAHAARRVRAERFSLVERTRRKG
jgi:hypothetical protein